MNGVAPIGDRTTLCIDKAFFPCIDSPPLVYGLTDTYGRFDTLRLPEQGYKTQAVVDTL